MANMLPTLSNEDNIRGMARVIVSSFAGLSKTDFPELTYLKRSIASGIFNLHRAHTGWTSIEALRLPQNKRTREHFIGRAGVADDIVNRFLADDIISVDELIKLLTECSKVHHTTKPENIALAKYIAANPSATEDEAYAACVSRMLELPERAQVRVDNPMWPEGAVLRFKPGFKGQEHADLEVEVYFDYYVRHNGKIVHLGKLTQELQKSTAAYISRDQTKLRWEMVDGVPAQQTTKRAASLQDEIVGIVRGAIDYGHKEVFVPHIQVVMYRRKMKPVSDETIRKHLKAAVAANKLVRLDRFRYTVAA